MWKNIIGFEHHYEISDSGEVRNKTTRYIFRGNKGSDPIREINPKIYFLGL